MALNYSIAMMGNPMNQEEAKRAYAKAQVSQELSLKTLAKRVSSQTTASRADVTAVIIATVENMIDGLRAGEQVDFGDLGKFRLQITSRGAETAEKFSAA
ncbi:HU family DNA-binding protein, partial [Bacteroides intestinalis]